MGEKEPSKNSAFKKIISNYVNSNGLNKEVDTPTFRKNYSFQTIKNTHLSRSPSPLPIINNRRSSRSPSPLPAINKNNNNTNNNSSTVAPMIRQMPKRQKYLLYFCGAFFFFLSYGAITIIFPYNKYIKAKKDHPELRYYNVPFSFLILHCAFHILACITCICVVLKLYFKWEKNDIIIIPCFITAIIWLYYVIEVGSSDLYSASKNKKNKQNFDIYIDQIMKIHPNRIVFASARAINRSGYHVGSCKSKNLVFKGISSIDSSRFDDLDLDDIDLENILIKFENKVEWSESDDYIITLFKTFLLLCAPSHQRVNGDYCSCHGWDSNAISEIPGYVNYMLVSLKGGFPFRLSSLQRIMKEIFWAPASYVYDVAWSSPLFTFSVVKYDAEINLSGMTAKRCSDMF